MRRREDNAPQPIAGDSEPTRRADSAEIARLRAESRPHDERDGSSWSEAFFAAGSIAGWLALALWAAALLRCICPW